MSSICSWMLSLILDALLSKPLAAKSGFYSVSSKRLMMVSFLFQSFDKNKFSYFVCVNPFDCSLDEKGLTIFWMLFSAGLLSILYVWWVALNGWVTRLASEMVLCLVRLDYFLLLDDLSFLAIIRLEIEVSTFLQGSLLDFSFPMIQFLFDGPIEHSSIEEVFVWVFRFGLA